MADDADALVVAAILQYFVMFVPWGIQIIRKKRPRKYWAKPWLTLRTVHGATTRCSATCWILAVWHLKISWEWISQHLRTCCLVSRLELSNKTPCWEDVSLLESGCA